MIRRLRRLHRIAFLILAVALPLLLAVAIAGRPARETTLLPAALEHRR
jgi:hypothetical protein